MSVDAWKEFEGTPHAEDMKRILQAAASNVPRDTVLFRMSKLAKNLSGVQRDRINDAVYAILEQRKQRREP